MEKLILIDGNSLFNRAFYATNTAFTNKEGVPTNAIYGFTNMLLKAITDLKPTRMAIAFDVKAPTFRHLMYSEYKGTRKGMPEELAVQVPLIKKMLKAMNIKMLELPGYEADDILGTIAKRYEGETLVLTGDNDYLQLVSDSTTIYLTKKGLSEMDIKTPQSLMDSHGLTPSQIIDLKALMGDTSDNIPGVAGVGEKTAKTLLGKYGTLDGVYEHIDEVKGKMKEKLINDKDKAYMSYELATINVETPIEFDIDDAIIKIPFTSEVVDIFNDFQFASILKRTEFFESGTVEPVEEVVVENIEISDVSTLNSITESHKDEKLVAMDLANCTFAYSKTKGYKVVVTEDLFTVGVSYDDYINAMKPLLEGDITLCLYDVKSVMHSLKARNITVNNAVYDIMLMQYVACYEPSLSTLQALLKFYDMSDTNSASCMLQILDRLDIEMKIQEVSSLYYDIERPLVDVLYAMENEGFNVDKTEIDVLRTQYQTEIASLTSTIHTLAGKEFNINSPKQLGVVLFDELQLTSGRKTKTGKSTDAETLEKLVDKHEIISYILRYRQISKLLSTYIEGMSSQIDGDGKIHTIFNQALTVTGRLSSKEPNLQNIPVRSNEGKVLRKLFIPTHSENLIVSADYSQIELRLLAHFSGDEILLDAYKHDKDIHAITAGQVFGVSQALVSSEMRASAKAVNFGIIYGISDYGLAKQINVSARKASEYIQKYFESYPSVKAYMNRNVDFCKEHGYVSTITGRRRIIREINSTNYNQRSFGERAAMNMPLQGSSADIIKIAMINVFNRLNNEKLQSKLILQIHDELIVDTVASEKDKVVQILKEEMENAVKLNVKLPVNVSFGESWYEAK